MKILNSCEIEQFSEEIYKIFREIPIDDIKRVVEGAMHQRKRYDEPHLDYSSEEETENEDNYPSESETETSDEDDSDMSDDD